MIYEIERRFLMHTYCTLWPVLLSNININILYNGYTYNNCKLIRFGITRRTYMVLFGIVKEIVTMVPIVYYVNITSKTKKVRTATELITPQLP